MAGERPVGRRGALMRPEAPDRQNPARSNEPLNPLRFFKAQVARSCNRAARPGGGRPSPQGRSRLHFSDWTDEGTGVPEYTNSSTCETNHEKNDPIADC